MGDFLRVVRVGDTDRGGLFVTVEYKAGRLSITGVEGPKANGASRGSAGQLIMSFREYDDRGHMDLSAIRPGPGWDADMIRRLFDVWDRWHNNDMRPGCEHQAGPGWEGGMLTLYHFRTSRRVRDVVADAEKRAKACVKSGATFAPSPEEVRCANLPDLITRGEAALPADLAADYEPNGPAYSGDTHNRASETKHANFVRPEEHPLGLLGKACPTCGYRYGSAWRREEVPADVLDWLRQLPTEGADRLPTAWWPK